MQYRVVCPFVLTNENIHQRVLGELENIQTNINHSEAEELLCLGSIHQAASPNARARRSFLGI